MKYEEPYRVPFFLGNRKNQASLATLVNIMLLVSEHQLDQVGAGIDALAQYNAGWVITQYQMKIAKMPLVEQPLVVGTEAVSYNKLMTYRNYWIRTEDGEKLARINGAWVMMDLMSRKIVPMKGAFPAKVGAAFDTHVTHYPRLKKLDRIDGSQSYHVRYFDIDNNGHVNNAHYLDWMEDSLGYDFLDTHELTEATVKYAREVQYDTTPKAEFELDGAVTHHQVVKDGQINAQAQMTWKQR